MGDNSVYKVILEHSPVGCSYNRIIYDDKGQPKDYELIEVNKAFESMVGIEGKELVGKRMSSIYEATKRDQHSWNYFYSNIIGKHRRKEFEYYFDFVNRHYRIKIHSLEKDYMIMYLTDITREVEEAEKLKMLSDNVPIQVWYLDGSNTYVSANKAHADFIGMERNELVLKNIKDVFSKETEGYMKGNKLVFKEKKEIVMTECLSNSHGEKRLLRISKNPKLNSKGEIEFVICSGEDITEEYMNKEQNQIKERILYSSMEFTQELLTNDNLEGALSNGIDMLGNATQVDRVYYWENHYDKDSKSWLTSQKFEWCLHDVHRQIDNPELQNVPFEEAGEFIGILAENKAFSSHVKDMDGGKNSTKQVLESQGILSILVIPVFVKDQFRGFIGFDSCKFEKEWSQVEISLLNSFVLLYVKALEKNLLEQRVIQVKENFFNFFNMIQDLLFVLDLEGNIIDMNNNVLDRLKYSREELLGKSILMLYPEDQIEEVKKQMDDLMSKKIEYGNIPGITKDGHVFPVETRISEGLWNEEPVIFSVSQDVSQLSMSEEKFSKAFNDSGISMFISKFEDGEILDVNDKFLDFIGYTREEVIGKTTLELNMTRDYENREIFKDKIKTCSKISDLEIQIISKDNRVRTGLTNIVPVNINNEKCLLSSIIDITDRVEYEKKILEISNRDSLTGVYNKHYVYQRMKETIEEYKRNGKIFSVCIIDIDNFKAVNDEYGHQAGDYVLIEFANIINDSLRIYDILGRYGGEEFIVVLNHCNIKESNVILKRILNILRNKNFVFNGHKIKLTFSAGISSCEELDTCDISIDKLVEIADKRMYVAKKSGKNGIVYKKIS